MQVTKVRSFDSLHFIRGFAWMAVENILLPVRTALFSWGCAGKGHWIPVEICCTAGLFHREDCGKLTLHATPCWQQNPCREMWCYFAIQNTFTPKILKTKQISTFILTKYMTVFFITLSSNILYSSINPNQTCSHILSTTGLCATAEYVKKQNCIYTCNALLW